MWRYLGCGLVHYGELPTTPLRHRQRSGHKGILCRCTLALYVVSLFLSLSFTLFVSF